MKTTAPFVLCGILAAGGGLCLWVQHEFLTDTIWTTPVLVEQSPSGSWKALVDETFDEPSWGGSVVIASVHLVSTRDSAEHAVILSLDEIGEQRPWIAWTDADLLQVTVPNLSYLTVYRREYDGVRIDLRFDPDDPAQRAVWLRKQQISPTPGPHR